MGRAHRVLVVFLATAICGTLGTAVATVAGGHGRPSARSTPAETQAPRGVASLAAVPAAPTDRLYAVATFRGRRPAAAAGLQRLGLTAVPLRNLPLALVSGTRAQLESAVTAGVATDVYPDERLRFYSAESTAAIRATSVRAGGLTGEGVGVAIVDSGVDGTHPDLADQVTHNVKLVGREHLDALGGKSQPDEAPGTLAVEMDDLPYGNSDTSSGHGTHVAGIVAADGTTGAGQVGVAPDADLIAYGTGEAISIFTVLAAFDDILTHREAWGIEVVNNSWGTSARPFDPDHPIHVGTKALYDAGLVVVFAAGNDSIEGTMNPFSLAPWVISVGSATVSKERSAFSSGGLEHDNSLPTAIPEDRHQRFEGDRLGIYHPDVSAPGTDIVSSGTPTGVGVASPSAPGGTATLSGTSMAAPHVAGLAAVLLQARPSLTPDQVRQVLQVTAVPMGDGAAFWQSGYGFLDAEGAVALVQRPDFGQKLLDTLQAGADARVLAARTAKVRVLDVWSFQPQFASVGGSDTRVFETVVGPETRALKAIVAYPSLALVGVNVFDWQVTLLDADANVVATSTASDEAGTSSLFVDLGDVENVTFGTWTLEVSGVLGASDTDTLLGDVISVAVSQVEPQAPAGGGPSFVRTGSHTLLFQDSTAAALLAVPLPSPEGCALTAGPVQGRMAAARFTDSCTTGVVGFATSHGADAPAEFNASAPLVAPVTLGGASSFTLWLADAAAPAWTTAGASTVSYTLEAVDAAGQAAPVAGGDLERKVDDAEEVGPAPTRAEYAFEIPPTTVPAGSTLRLRLRFSGVYTSTMRLLFGGAYGDAGVTLGAGHFTG